MIEFREIKIDEVSDYFEFLKTLDTETKYMMFEPDERAKFMSIESATNDISKNVINGNDFLQIALENGKIIGFIRAVRGKFKRNFHTAYIVVGILKDYTGKKIGTKFFENLEKWAKENSICRLELTVEKPNHIAKRLYEKMGFKEEGYREKSMFVDGNFVDEYYMVKFI